MIDLKAREALLRRKENQRMVSDIGQMVKTGGSDHLLEPLKETGLAANNQVAISVMMLQVLQEVSEAISNLKVGEGRGDLTELANALREIKAALRPGTQKVEVTNPQPIVSPDFTPLVNAVYDLKKDLGKTKPGKKDAVVDNMPLLNSLEMIAKKLDLLYQKDEGDKVRSVEITNFPPRMVTPPVTNISLNALRGVVNARPLTMTSTSSLIPPDPLPHRRTMIIFNNSSQNLYIGGADVTINSGLVILPNTFSPAIDAGDKVNVYGVVASGTADIRLFEISDEDRGQ